jgi:predicted ester cyclase
VPGPDGFYATATWLRAAFADLRYEIHEVLAEGDLVAVNSTMLGRHAGTFVLYTEEGAVDAAFPPTGKAFAMTQSHWFRLRDGRITEHWANRDDFGHAQQVGWLPPSPPYLLRMVMAKRRAKKALRRDSAASVGEATHPPRAAG